MSGNGSIYRLKHEQHRFWGNLCGSFKVLNEIETITEPRDVWYSKLEHRVTKALKALVIGEAVFVEGVRVERLTAGRGMRYQINNGRFTIEQAGFEILRLAGEREQV